MPDYRLLQVRHFGPEDDDGAAPVGGGGKHGGQGGDPLLRRKPVGEKSLLLMRNV